MTDTMHVTQGAFDQVYENWKRAQDRVEQLEQGIEQHREHTLQALDPTENDYRLWFLLDDDLPVAPSKQDGQDGHEPR